MIHIIRTEESTIYYKCDCGTYGLCTVKPQEKDAAIVVDIRCPNCPEIERVVLLQYSSEEDKSKLEENLDEMELTWSSIVENKVLDKEGA